MIKGLKLPVQVISGTLCDNIGNPILLPNRKVGDNPIQPTEMDALVYLVSDLINREFPTMKESIKETVKDSLNEAQLGDKVMLGKERGYLIGQSSNGEWIVQIQGSTKMAKDKDVKVISGHAQNVILKPPMKFDDKTQKLLFEQFIKCGIFYGNVPIKMNDCYVRYSEFSKARSGENINVLIEGNLNIMSKDQVKIFDDPNDFANPLDYVEAVIIDDVSKEAIANILVHAGDYSNSIGDADPVRVITNPNQEDSKLETLPKGMVKTLSV
jgi:hypothetical protein